MHFDRREIFLDTHALILVLGGTVAAALIGFPLKQAREAFRFLLLGVFFAQKSQTNRVIAQLIVLSTRPEPSSILPHEWRTYHPYLVEGYLILQKNDFSLAEFKMILQGRQNRTEESYAWDAKFLTALAKFPPAFGLLGASTGMIAMMSHLGSGGKDSIGPSMAIALVATFWGIALANLLLLPLADRAHRLNAEDAKLRSMITSALVLMHQSARPQVIFEHLIGFVPMNERNDPTIKRALFIIQNRNKQKSAAA